MRMISSVLICVLLVFGAAYAQGDRGTITGTVADAAGAMVPNVPIEAKNTETGAVYKAASSATGNYTIAQLPAGTYQLTATLTGFKQYVRTGITVQAAQTLRIDIPLEVGNISETVTVSADAPLLKTESGELSHNVSTERLNDLPILSAAGMRDPYQVVNLLPGASTQTGALRVNGMPGFTMSLRIDGQDATQNIWTLAYNMSQPGVDSVEETAVQTSNYSAEYGTAGGGILNMTMRSGTNKLHGGAFEYFRNEALDAHRPFSHAEDRDRRHDFGFYAGGPIYLPKIYDGRDKSFFFWTFETNRTKTSNNTTLTVPTQAYRAGDFSNPILFTQRVLGTDAIGRQILDGTVYDPATTRTVIGTSGAYAGQSVTIRDPFPGNKIPAGYALDPVAVKYQGFVPLPTDPNSLFNNYAVTTEDQPVTTIHSFKIDHSLSSKMKISGYYSLNDVRLNFPDGFKPPITGERDFTERTHTIRLNLDYTVSPTVLLHLGAGIMHFIFKDPQPNINFDSLKELGLPGTFVTIPPSMQGLLVGGKGGLTATGTQSQSNTWQIKPTGNASLSWVKGNHTYKFGGEVRFESHPVTNFTPANGAFYFDAQQTALPYLAAQPQGGTLGFPYASFLTGKYNNGEIGKPNRYHLGKQAWSFYGQDSWKITPKLTLDYGLRWDYQTYLNETYGRMPSFSDQVVNPRFGNLKGGVAFEINGNKFAKNYPHAWGPRLGLAYQFMPKTVLRAGFGVTYAQTGALEMWSLRLGSFVRYASSLWGMPVGDLKNGPNVGGVPVVPVWPNFDPGQLPINAGDNFLPWIDHNAGRPARQFQWSFGIQRELSRDMSLDISYVGNRGVWWNSNGALTDPNRVTPAILAAHNLSLNNAADRTLLTTPLSAVSAADRAAHGLAAPFTGFSGSVSQSIRPFPHVGGIYVLWAPRGNTWYDSLQAKLTKRFSRGLDLTVAYTFQKELTVGAETFDTAFEAVNPAINNIGDLRSNKVISGLSQPHRLVIGATYTIPSIGINRFLSEAVKDWQFGSMLTYASGLPIMAPRSLNNIGGQLSLCAPQGVIGNACNGGTFWNDFASYQNRNAGVPLFLADLNSHYDPFRTFVLNPAAWSTPPDGQFGSGSAYYSDYRFGRRPVENMNLARLFRIREGMTLSIRVELFNVFNRVVMPYVGTGSDPFRTAIENSKAPQQFDANGKTVSGFGYVDALNTAGQRTGQIVARFTF